MPALPYRIRLASSMAVLPLAALLAAAPAATAAPAVNDTAPAAVTSTRLPVTIHLTLAQAKAAKFAATRKAHRAATRRRMTHLKLAPKKATPKPVVVPAPTPAPSAAPVLLTPFEARMVFLVNGARAQNGLAALTVTAGTTDVARRWAVQLAGDDALSHNPELGADLQAAGSPGWTFLAENVGTAPIGDADGLFAAYLNSPPHRANILDPRATSLGMGAVAAPESDGDAEWNVMDFVNDYQPTNGATPINGGKHTNGVGEEEPGSQLRTDIGG